MGEGTYILAFFFVSTLLFYVGRHEFPISNVVTWLLAFAGTGTVAVLVLSLHRVRAELRLSQLELAQRNAELSFARDVQTALFPQRFPEGFGLEFAALCIPSHAISGDYYDVQELSQDCLLFALADLSGKGVPAALLMASLQAQLRVLGKVCSDLTQLTAELNSHLYLSSETARFATLFVAKWDKRDRLFTYVNAGHPPPAVLASNETIKLTRGGPPIGLFSKNHYETGQIHLQPADLLVLYSDGITEAISTDGHEFGEERLLEVIHVRQAQPLNDIHTHVIKTIQDWSTLEPADDMTLMLIRSEPLDGGES